MSEVVAAIRNGQFNTQEYAEIAEALGAALSNAWFEDTMTYGQSYKNILHQSDETCITSECNKVVKSFCQALCVASDNAEKRETLTWQWNNYTVLET